MEKDGLYQLIREIENKEFLKLIISFRSDYEQLLVSDEVKKRLILVLSVKYYIMDWI